MVLDPSAEEKGRGWGYGVTVTQMRDRVLLWDSTAVGSGLCVGGGGHGAMVTRRPLSPSLVAERHRWSLDGLTSPYFVLCPADACLRSAIPPRSHRRQEMGLRRQVAL